MDKLTVLSRIYGKGADAAGFIAATREALRPFALQFIICTAEGDSVAAVVDKAAGVSVVFADMKRFDIPVNVLLKAASEQRASDFTVPDALFLSPGIGVTAEKIAVAKVRIRRDYLHWYGWQITDQFNDGSRPGKLNYNACTLYNGARLTKHAGTVPEYVNNGVLGELGFDWQGETKRGPAGGGEETVQMCLALQEGYVIDEHGNTDSYSPDAKLFGFDPTVLPSAAKTSTGGIGFDWKIQRKVPMALEYLKRFGMTEAEFMAHVQIYK